MGRPTRVPGLALVAFTKRRDGVVIVAGRPGGSHAPLARGLPKAAGVGTTGRPASTDRAQARDFLVQYYAENPDAPGDLDRRWAQVRREIDRTGTYTQTSQELTFGVRVAWRNSVRCVGRWRWPGLVVRDERHLTDAGEVFASIVRHVREATNGGRIRCMISVFAPDAVEGPRVRIWNEQFFRYAGWRNPDGTVIGDPRLVGFTRLAERLGWAAAERGPFVLLPLIVHTTGEPPRLFEFAEEDVAHVPITHPDHDWSDLGLRWYALPVVSHLRLRIGGLDYSAAPFNGYYVGDEIGSRDLADEDRYNLLPEVARRLGLDTRTERTLWRERALVEINRAVLHSFACAGVSISDPHVEARRFMRFVEQEERAGRCVRADWSWINSHLAPPLTPTFFRYFDPTEINPNFWLDPEARAVAQGRPPAHILDDGASPVRGASAAGS